jgi:DNA polymerase-1
VESKNYGRIDSVEELQRFINKLTDSDKTISIDCEAGYLGDPKPEYSLHPETAILVGISFTNDTRWARYVAVGHDDGPNLDNYEVARLFWQLVNTERCIAHHSKYELRILAWWFRKYLSDDPEFGAAVRASRGYWKMFSDSMLESYVLGEQEKHGLKHLTAQLFGHEQRELISFFPGLPKNKAKTLRFNILDATDPEVVDYACEDAVWCLAIHEKYYPQVKDRLIYKLEMAIVPVLCDMEDYGIRYDWEHLRKGKVAAQEFLKLLDAQIMEELSELVGSPVSINLGSPKQLSDTLFTQLGLRTSRYTATSKNTDDPQMSTDAQALTGMAAKHPAVQKIIWWREVRKLIGTYLTKYEREFSYAEDGRVHPSHNQVRIISGRFAHNSPNYAQDPQECAYVLSDGTRFDFVFRDAVIAPDYHYILGFDVSQGELRVLAGEAQEPGWLELFNNEYFDEETGKWVPDIHTQTAAMMLDVKYDEVTKEQRSIGKELNFSMQFGMAAKSLGERMGISKDAAATLIDKYFSTLSKVHTWGNKQKAIGRHQGYVTSRMGRHQTVWQMQSTKSWEYAEGERLCVNGIVQGGLADYVKMTMVRAHQSLHDNELDERVHMVMNVHDALYFYVHDSVRPETVVAALQDAVVFPVPGWPPMRVDWSVGAKWGSLKSLRILADGSAVISDKS